MEEDVVAAQLRREYCRLRVQCPCHSAGYKGGVFVHPQQPYVDNSAWHLAPVVGLSF